MPSVSLLNMCNLSSSFPNLWSTVIINTLMALFAIISSVSLLGLFQFIDIYPYYRSYFSSFFTCLVIFVWVLDIESFIFLISLFFCYTYNVLAVLFLFWHASRLLGNSLVLPWTFLGGGKAAFNLELILTQYWSKIFFRPLCDASAL